MLSAQKVLLVREWVAFLIDAAILYVLVEEYWFDRKVYEQKRRRIKRTKEAVRVVVEDGKAVVTEKPENVNVVIDQRG